LKPKVILVKFVRANMLADWIMNQCHFHYKPIFLIRHPVAISQSQLKTFAQTEGKADIFHIPACRNNQRFKEYAEYLNTLENPLERHVALWCINNLPVIRNAELMNKMHVIYYENLLTDPRRELDEIGKLWGENFSVSESEIRKPSKTTNQDERTTNIEKQLIKWRVGVPDVQLDKLQNVLDYFGCTLYNIKSPWPVDPTGQKIN
jgi:hypothetical protein